MRQRHNGTGGGGTVEGRSGPGSYCDGSCVASALVCAARARGTAVRQRAVMNL